MAEFVGRLKGHQRDVKIVLIQGLRKNDFLLFTTRLSLSAEEMIEIYAARSQIENTFRELKQDVGAFNYRQHSQRAILKYVHMAFVAYALMKYLALQKEVVPQEKSWYKPKGLASPKQVQKAMNQRFQALRIFEGVLKNGLLRKNMQFQDFMRVLYG